MIKYFCDKCKKEVDRSLRIGSEPLNLHNIVYFNLDIDTGYTSMGTSGWEDKHYQAESTLCYDCYKEYSELVTNFMKDKV